MTVRLSLPRERYAQRADVARFIEALRPRLLALPGVPDAAAVNVVPLNNYLATTDLWRADRPAPPPDQLPEAHYRMITPELSSDLRRPVLIAGVSSTTTTRRRALQSSSSAGVSRSGSGLEKSRSATKSS